LITHDKDKVPVSWETVANLGSKAIMKAVASRRLFDTLGAIAALFFNASGAEPDPLDRSILKKEL